MDMWNDNKPVLEKLGAAFFEAQSLEATLVNLFAGDSRFFQTDWLTGLQNLLDERHSNRVLGKLEMFFLHLDLPAALMPRIHQALMNRNWLLHHFYFEFGQAVFDDRESGAVLQILEEKTETLTQLVIDLNEILIDRQLEADLANEVINNQMDNSIKAYLGHREMI